MAASSATRGPNPKASSGSANSGIRAGESAGKESPFRAACDRPLPLAPSLQRELMLREKPEASSREPFVSSGWVE
jgi:hypothetical protein